MLLKKGKTDLLPCAGITLIRFTGIISAYVLNAWHPTGKHPGNAEKLTTVWNDVRAAAKIREKNERRL